MASNVHKSTDQMKEKYVSTHEYKATVCKTLDEILT